MTKEQLKDYLVREAEYDREEVDAMSAPDLLDAWLQWEGIIGFTYEIIRVVKAVGIENL